MSLIKINNSRCKSCYLCVTTCPKGLIKKSDKTNRLGDYLVEFESEIMKGVTKGVYKKNTAARKKSALAKKA
mgnify:CR=1 FL=1